MSGQVRVFVSHHHSSAEDVFTARLVSDLEAAGADVWVDTGQIESGNFMRTINEGLSGRQWMVLVMTPESLQSRWVQEEVYAALHQVHGDRMLGVIPVVAKACDESNIPAMWATLHRYDATLAYEPARDGLLRALGLPLSRYPLPDVPVRLASLGFRGVNTKGMPAILPPLIPIPAGPFLMGSDKSRDNDARRAEFPQHSANVARFRISKYPVTVAEYAFAVRAGAVLLPAHWAAQQHCPDHPVVSVSWNDAMKYLTWVIKATGQRGWRLPTEAEREKAARGTDGRIYPWGDSFDSDRCNSCQSGINTTTSVGSYPASDAQRSGASPYGVEDMAGNVSEWTSSLYRPYPYDLTDGREDQTSTENRMLRGGSWNGDGARAAYREPDGPDANYYSYGFRLALAPEPGS